MNRKSNLKLKSRCAAVVALGVLSANSLASTYNLGDVFAAIGNGRVNWYRADGTFVQTLDTTVGGFTTGMAFDGSGSLYVTGFSANRLAKFNNSGGLLNANYVSGLSTPESVLFDKTGNLYVGNVNGGIGKYDSTGAFLGTVQTARTDWFDLTADQSTFLYTQEGGVVKTVSNALPGTAGPNFTSGGGDFALRILSDGSVLVADEAQVDHFDSAGNIIGSYDVAGEDSWFALNLNPDGKSFWSGNFNSGKAYEFDIASGNMTQTIDTGAPGNFFGLVIFGEKTEGGPPPPTGTPDAGSTATLLLISVGMLQFIRRK